MRPMQMEITTASHAQSAAFVCGPGVGPALCQDAVTLVAAGLTRVLVPARLLLRMVITA